jgi:hypothetical protein
VIGITGCLSPRTPAAPNATHALILIASHPAPQKGKPRARGAPLFAAHCRLSYRFIVDPGAGTDDGIPPGVRTVGLVPVLEPLFTPGVDPVVPLVPLLIPVVPVPVDPEPPTAPGLEPAAPVAAAPPVPPPPAAPPAPCARAIEELMARTDAKAIVVSFMCFSFVANESTTIFP